MVHQHGYSIVVVVMHSRCSTGMVAANIVRFARLGILIVALQLPWVVSSGVSAPSPEFQRAGFPSNIGASALQALAEST
eukprot:6012446-Pyramimonas_sp.AAC.1